LSIPADDKPWIEELRRTERLPASYTAAIPEYVAPLAGRVQALRAYPDRPAVIGINGAQGSGKTTFALFLSNWLEREQGMSSAIVSLDDLYLARHAREVLAERYHPLLRTRGVPGTHDVALGISILDALTGRNQSRVVKLPVFDKTADDLRPQSEWRSVAAPVDVVLFEGWCVGAQPQSDASLNSPVNTLEAEDDPDGIWRRFVNEKLAGDYVELFGRIDALVMLRIPSFDNVYAWRELQEQKSHEASANGMNADELGRFVMHFERLTRHMLKHMPGHANTLIEIDASHQMVAMTHRSWPFERAPS
jgi:D-glycerate 3-kinase